MFSLAISCLTMFNLPWCMDLTLQVPVQYCSLEHQTLLSHQTLLDTSTTGCSFRFGPAASFFLELFIIAVCSAPVACWTPSDLWRSSFGVVSFCLLILLMGFSRLEYWGWFLFPTLVNHLLSEFFTMTHPSWVALNDMAHWVMQAPSPQQGCNLWRTELKYSWFTMSLFLLYSKESYT